LGLPLFVKPANLGSSVGISKVTRAREFPRAVARAFRYDSKILIEENISGRELECAVLGNENPIASVPGEIITGHSFYSYDAKYIDAKGARLVIPARLPRLVARRVQQLSVRAFQVLCCAGMARVDFFLRGRDEIFVNEINTIPGFTQISMYPKMWAASGLSYSRLIDRLIQLALQKYRAENYLSSSL
jgi:D-alanine-D-alanine ligase